MISKTAGCVVVLCLGWLAGRQVWPWMERTAAAAESGARIPGAELIRDKPAPGDAAARVEPKPDAAAAARLAREATGEHAVRDGARRMALAPPPALADYLALATDSEPVRAALLEDAVAWAYYRNPSAGLAQLSALPAESGATETIVKKALHFFPPKDLPVVLAWYEKLPAGKLRLAALTEISPVLARRDFAKAVALTAALPQGDEEAKNTRQTRLEKLLELSPQGRSERAMETALESFPPEDRESLGAAIQGRRFGELFNSDRDGAVAMLAALPPAAQAEYAGRTAEMFQNWAENDPILAARAMDRVPESVRSEELYSGFAAKWAEGNVGMASQWVNDLPAGPWREAASRGLIRGLSKDYPAEALTWAAALEDPAARAESLRSVFTQSAADRRADLLQTLDSLPLTPEQKQALRDSPPP